MKNTYLEKRKFTRSCEGQQVYSRSKLKLSVFVLALTAVLILGFENRSEAQSIIYGGAFDITSGVTFDDISPINVNSFPLDIEFSRDGLTMFVLDGSDKEIDYFSLTEPFVTTSGVSLDGSFVVSSFEFNANGFCFSNDGMKMFLVGSSGDDVSGFNLTNPYDLSTGVTEDGSAFPVSDQVEPPRDVVLSANGKKMFVLGATAVYQYSLVVPNRVFNGVSYDNVSFSVSSQDASCFSLSFNEEGSRMFILGGTGKDINQYNLLNPFDLSSGASFAGDPFGVSGQESFPRGVALSQSGNRMFVVGTTGDDVNQYSLDVDEGFSETGANDGTVAGSITLDLHGDVFTNPNSTLDYGTDYSISNLPAGLTSSLTVSSNAVSATLSFSGKATTHQRTDDISNLAIDFENSAFGGADASSVVGAVDQEIYYGISFDNNSAVLTYGSGYEINHSPDLDGDFAVSGQEGFSTSLTFSNDGDKLFVAGINSDAVFQYSLTTPFDITVGVTYDNVSLSVNSPQDIDFNNDGTKMFILRDGLTGSQVVYQYTLTTPFDLSSGVSQDDAYLYVLAQDSDPRSITFSNDGYTMLLTGLSQTLYQYTLSEPFDFSGEETLEVSTFDFSGQDTAPQDIDFNKTGTRLYMVGRNSDNINEYSLPVPFDISGGISHTGNTMSVGSQLGLPRGMAFNDGGTKVFAIGSGVNKVFQYSLNNESIFNESAVGDGSLDDTDKAVIRLVGDNFSSAGSVLSGSAYSVTNLPAGLSPVLNVAADGKSADFSISGSAVSHSDTDDLENLIFTFENSAFVSGNAATVINSNNTESGFGIDFEDDITAPSLTSLSPQDDAIDVSLDAIFTLNFDEPVAPGAGSILVKRVSDDVSISIHNVSSAVTFEGNSVSFTPFAGLATHHNTEFYIQVPSGAIEDQSGNTYEGFSNNTTWSVTTEDLQPYIVSLDPSDEDVDVSANSNFAINFDKPIAKGTGLISFYRENRDEFIFSVDVSSKYVSVTGNVAVVNPFDDLPEKENVYITMANTTFISPEGINSEAIIKGEWNFATADETAPLMSAISPVDNSTEISNEANLVITFDEDVQKGTGVVSVKRMSDDFLLQSFNISESFATISTNTLTVDLPSPLPYDTEVYVEFGTGVILDLAGNNFGGVAKPDWSFTIEEAPDTTPPTITDF
ncbi:MAG: Ig-like domain-containing protein, partial [Cyclobacteriaceae bacterium]